MAAPGCMYEARSNSCSIEIALQCHRTFAMSSRNFVKGPWQTQKTFPVESVLAITCGRWCLDTRLRHEWLNEFS